MTKLPNKKERKRIRQTASEAKAQLEHYRGLGFRIIYIDETMVTKSTIGTHEWSRANTNFEMDMKYYAKETVAVLAGISKEFGLDHLAMYPSSVNIPKFKLWLQDLRDKYFFADLVVYCDNLSVHRSKQVRERMDELSIGYVFSPPYSPDLNPIERIFSIAKRELKKRRLQAVLHG